MKTNKEKFLNLTSGVSDKDFLNKVAYQHKNRKWLNKSTKIAIKILSRLDELNWTKAQFADMLGVSPQQVTKITKGHENLTLKTIEKIERTLDIALLADTYEEKLMTAFTEFMGGVFLSTFEKSNDNYVSTLKISNSKSWNSTESITYEDGESFKIRA